MHVWAVWLSMVPEKDNSVQMKILAVGNLLVHTAGPRSMGRVLIVSVRVTPCTTQGHWCLTEVHSILPLLYQVGS